MAKSIEYAAFVLDEESHQSVARLGPEGWEVKAHHMTIISPRDMKSGRLPSRWLEYEGCLTVVAIAQNDLVMTALVDIGGLAMPMKGPTLPHVTIAINAAEGGKAKMSNDFIEADYESIEPIQICGAVEEVMK